tara:strand:+ start:127 stop:768 length:642 start_codon:yes stop_codon:yes gene_type:complete
MTNEITKRILSSIILIPLVFFFIIKGSFYFNFFIFMCFLVTIYEWYKMNKKNIYFIYGCFFLVFSFYTVYDLRIEGDYKIFLLVFISCIATDIGGYTFGKIFKGPKLTKISPNKTYAGVIGGFFLTIVFSYIYFNNFKFFGFDNDMEMSIEIFIFVLLISFMSQIGDLTISFFKRHSKIKNTGMIIPGHGGLLDRIDGMIFAFPFVYILLRIF